MERPRPVAVGDLVSVAAWHFDNVPAGKQHIEQRWSYQTYGAAWRTARCSGKVTKNLGKGQWQVAWTDPGWEGKQDVVKTTALRIETEGVRNGKQPAAAVSPPQQPEQEEEQQPDSRAAAAARRAAAREAAHAKLKDHAEPNHQDAEVEPEETDEDDEEQPHEDPTQPESDRKRRRVDASPLGDTDAPLENAAEPLLAEATAPEAVPMAVEPAPQTSASSDAPTAETEAPGAEVAAPSDAPAAISTPDDALDGTVALATDATTEQLVAAGVAGAPKGPLAQAKRRGCSQCERNPFCWRGFKHDGKGGLCAVDKAAMAAAAAAYPAAFAKSPLKSPSVHARPAPPKLLVSVSSREPDDSGSTPQGTPSEPPKPRSSHGLGGCELLSSKLLTDIPAWMLEEELKPEDLDKKLWEGAADAGWRMLPKYRGGGSKNNWVYLAPSGAQLKNRASALVAAADHGAAAAAAALAGQAEPRRLSGARLGAGLERASTRAALTSPDRPSGCLRKRNKSEAATQDMSKEFGAKLVEPASERLRSGLWQPTPLPAVLSSAEAARRMEAARSRGVSRASAPPPIVGGSSATPPKLGGMRRVLEQLATAGASERTRQRAQQMLAGADAHAGADADADAPMAVGDDAAAAAATVSAGPAPEVEVAMEVDGTWSPEPTPVEEAVSEDALGRGSRARRLPKWRVEEAADDAAEDAKPRKTPRAKASESDAAAGAQDMDEEESDDDDDDDEADAPFGSFAGGSACWGIYYLQSGRDGIDRVDAERDVRVEAPAAAPATSADGGGGAGEGGPAKKWVAPPLGEFVAVPGGDGTWVKGQVVQVSARKSQATLTVRVSGGAVHSCAQKDEGKTWKRIGPAVNALVEVEVEEEGEISWRLARVRQRFKNGDFTAVVLFPDGSPDEDFVEKFPLSAEGIDWRHTAQSNGTGFEPTAMSGGGGGGGGGGESPAEAAAAKPKDSKRGKRFDREVTDALEAAFSRSLRGATPSGEALAQLRQLTGLEAMQVQGWFANRRIRHKKELQQQQQLQLQQQQQHQDEEDADRREEEEAIRAAQARAKAEKTATAVVEL